MSEKLIFSEKMKEWFIKYQGDLQRRKGKRPTNDEVLEDLLMRTRFYQVERRKVKKKLDKLRGDST